MGDVAMTVPVLRALTQQYPDVKVTVATRAFFEPIFHNIPNVSFFGVDVKQKHKGFIGLLQLFSDLRKLNVDAVADLHNVIRSKTLRKLFIILGKKVASSNKGRAEKKALTQQNNKVFKPLKTMFEVHCDTFKKLGFEINLKKQIFPAKENLSAKTVEILSDKSEFLIGIAPFAQYESKVYPQDLLEEIIKDLSENENYKVILFGGGKQEIDILNNISSKYENVINISGKINFTEELNLISNLNLMLSMDSGNAHLAAMYGVKTITLWGATHPFAGFSPFNQKFENAIVSDRKKYPFLPTSVYGNKTVTGYQDVMRTILPETVVDKIKDELE